jgi:hypothetical protein
MPAPRSATLFLDLDVDLDIVGIDHLTRSTSILMAVKAEVHDL